MVISQSIAVFYHIFYEDSCKSVCEELKPLLTANATFFFNICSETPGKRSISKVLREIFPSCFIIYTSNKGKDIGAKFALLQLFFQLNIEADYILFLHDKKSLQALKSSTWKNDLLKIISAKGIQTMEKIFQRSDRYGIIATREYIIDESVEGGSFVNVNGKILSNLLLEYNMSPVSFAFVAGTMFWARVKPFAEFFSRHSPLEIRKYLEDGNILDDFSGTVTHSWERMLSWIVTSQGYSIKGI